jgi:flavin reductase (DIM6/NTAB) family NADH-FMN oxidoreductase RutF
MIAIEPLNEDPALLRRAFGCFPSGVTVVSALVDGDPIGMAASSFTSVSLDPPLVSVCFQEKSSTWQRLRTLSRLGISVLAQGQDAICMSLARPSDNRFATVGWDHTADGAVLVRGATAWLECSPFAEVPAGDHTIALLQIDALQVKPDAAPLVFHSSKFRRLAVIAFEGDRADFVEHDDAHAVHR